MGVWCVLRADREAALWEMEEHQLQERHQLVKQQLKDQYFLQRHDLLRKHEKVRRGGMRTACWQHPGRAAASTVRAQDLPQVPRVRDRNQGNYGREEDGAGSSFAHPNTSVLGSLSSKPVLGYLKLLYPPPRG